MYIYEQPDLIPPYNRTHKKSNTFNEILLISFITSISIIGILLISGLIFYFIRRNRSISEDELRREEENQAYLELNSDEQELYFQSKDYLKNNPYICGEPTLSQNLSIQEKGINAFEFQKDLMLTNNDLLILNKTELNFFKKFECCSQTNLPIPLKNEVYYFESKIYSLPNPEETIISIGLAIKPYPWFRLPGRHLHSISYDSNGYRRYNQPFKFNIDPPFPKLSEGDVVGVGYRTRSGTIFFTRNGKKISESKIGGHIKNFKFLTKAQIFPTIGANNICSVHVNLGQRGYVFIEGNVKNWGFAPIEGTGPSPPAYNKFNADILLERSEIGDDDGDGDGFQDRINDFPPDFFTTFKNESTENENKLKQQVEREREGGEQQDRFSYNAYSEVNSTDERITLNSLIPPNRPPSYEDEHEISEEINHNEFEQVSTQDEESQDTIVQQIEEEEETRQESNEEQRLEEVEEQDENGIQEEAIEHNGPEVVQEVQQQEEETTGNQG
ncbi:ssh4 [Candida pseudojiufengensis]|uniref:ssh4 n=1 Tax=Candida pseudojiufengensis TaxID=497109 RepID=UPI002225738F|nr:ssh4 [Candida pseudojiufengensis]KAI5965752.1 ssh4 [Candida pseudojiufengensis]